MQNEPKRHPAFNPPKIEAVDHRNPPRPKDPERSGHEQPVIEAVDVHNPPVAKPAATE